MVDELIGLNVFCNKAFGMKVLCDNIQGYTFIIEPRS